VGRTEGVVHVQVGQGREPFGESRIVLRLAGVEAGVLEQHDARSIPTVEGLLHLGTDGGVELLHGSPSSSRSFAATGSIAYFGSGSPFGASEVGDQAGLAPSESRCRMVGSARRMRVSSVTSPSLRHVEIHPNQHALPANAHVLTLRLFMAGLPSVGALS
jgi:hypothetical protein